MDESASRVKVLSIGWLGVRTDRDSAMAAFFRDVLGLEPIQGGTGHRFRLHDGTEAHVYPGDDRDHDFFGGGPVVGFAVASFAAARAALVAAGIEFIYPAPQRLGGRAWQHFRAPDGNVYEIIGPDDLVFVERESPRQGDVIDLIAKLDDHVAGLYPPESNHLVDIEALCAAEVRFLVARRGGVAVGCGALRVDARGYGEVKRMFVRADQRGKGVGRAILRRVEEEGRKLRLSFLRLETGNLQMEALRLYRSEGYREIPPFGDYRPDPRSVFMEKRIDGDRQDSPTSSS